MRVARSCSDVAANCRSIRPSEQNGGYADEASFRELEDIFKGPVDIFHSYAVCPVRGSALHMVMLACWL